MKLGNNIEWNAEENIDFLRNNYKLKLNDFFEYISGLTKTPVDKNIFNKNIELFNWFLTSWFDSQDAYFESNFELWLEFFSSSSVKDLLLQDNKYLLISILKWDLFVMYWSDWYNMIILNKSTNDRVNDIIDNDIVTDALDVWDIEVISEDSEGDYEEYIAFQNFENNYLDLLENFIWIASLKVCEKEWNFNFNDDLVLRCATRFLNSVYVYNNFEDDESFIENNGLIHYHTFPILELLADVDLLKVILKWNLFPVIIATSEKAEDSKIMLFSELPDDPYDEFYWIWDETKKTNSLN